MDISADRGVEIAQGIAEIQRICDTYGLTMESNNNHGFTWFEVWASDVDAITITPTSGTFAEYSKFALYGIKGA